ncbi:hypothetical protein Mpsy_2492 [Methanolobus psychrophilus R15]|nr:hypothetical protein Mpsy_2492 [Methanolobus psychrophilus R15]
MRSLTEPPPKMTIFRPDMSISSGRKQFSCAMQCTPVMSICLEPELS